MIYQIKYLFTVLSLLLLFGCNGEDSNIENNITTIEESFTIGIGSTFTYSLGNGFPVEGYVRITKQANHFELSEIITGNTGKVFQYKPEGNFIGKDYVEITQSYSNGSNNFTGKTIFKISITITSD